MSPEFQRAQLLLQQGRFELAEAELHKVLLENPNDAYAHSLLAHCYVNLAKYDDAEREAGQGIALAPDSGFVYYIRATVLLRRNKFKEAEQSAREAIALDPTDADYYQSLASALLMQSKWQAALDAATEGLSHDPEHVNCMNSRTMALTNLGRKADAIQAVDQTLANDPDNTMAHTNKGWALLHQGNAKPAIEHFREALRLDPENDYAKSGMVEAIKAQNFLYRWILSYFLWMSRLSGQVQIALILGMVFGARILRSVGESLPAIKPYITPILLTYIGFVFLTWFAMPLSNFMLRFHRFGRHVLDRDQRVASNWLAVCLIIAIGGFIGTFFDASDRALIVMIIGIGMAIPLVSIYKCSVGWPRIAMTAYTVLAAILAVVCLMEILKPNFDESRFFMPFVYCAAAATWIGNILPTFTVRR